NCSDGTAVLNYDGIAIRSRASWRLKRWIDARWMAKFQNLDRLRMEPSEDAPMRCGGCGSKISSTVLHNVLSRLRVPRHEAMIVGLDEAEDAAVWRPPSTHVEVHSVDFFRAFLNDPYLFGQIAVQ